MSRARASSFIGTAAAARVSHTLDNTQNKVGEYRRDVERVAQAVHPALRVTLVDNNNASNDALLYFELGPLPRDMPTAECERVRRQLEAATARDLGALYTVDERIAKVPRTDAHIAAFSRVVAASVPVWCIVRHNVPPLLRTPAATIALYAAFGTAAVLLLLILKHLLDWFPAGGSAL